VVRVSGWVGAVAYHKAASSISQHVTDLTLGICSVTISTDAQISCLEHICNHIYSALVLQTALIYVTTFFVLNFVHRLFLFSYHVDPFYRCLRA
jgi:hypothetical protein